MAEWVGGPERAVRPSRWKDKRSEAAVRIGEGSTRGVVGVICAKGEGWRSSRVDLKQEWGKKV